MKIGLNEKLIPNVLFTKFLGLTVYSTLSWRIHIDHLATKLSTDCHVITSVKPLTSHTTLLLIYHSLFLRVMTYRIKFGGNFCHSIQIFWMQKRVFFLAEDIPFYYEIKRKQKSF